MLKRLSLASSLLILMVLTNISVIGQTSVSSKPMSSSLPDLYKNCELIELKPPDVRQLLEEDKLSENLQDPYRMGVSLPVNINCTDNGMWKDVPGGKLWLLRIRSHGATALGLYFNKFSLTEGCRVHVYDSARTQVLGALTNSSNPMRGMFAAGITPGEVLYIECYCPDFSATPDIIIDEVLYVYRSGGIPHVNSTRDFGGADSCEVNINCEEGLAWQDAKHGILRILVKIGGSSFWCTGSLINNTRNDFTPYIITADHCAKRYGGIYATPTDLQKWIFYFNFESADCSNPLEQPAIQSSVGATKLASASSDSGSDFYLAMLNHKIPGSFMPYYNGWDRSGNPASSGVTIHQPQGDIKKISTYNTTLTTGEWGDAQGTHWLVTWVPTVNGNGVTEPGSSGSPLFDESGHILGCLTGGNSSCTNLLSPDYYGKLSYSWESNGSADSLQLRTWLDPDNTGVLDVRGIYDTNRIVADFNADNLVIPVGSYVNFTDRTSGDHSTWQWTFDGAEPSTSNLQSPSGILYSRFGSFNVKMIAGNEYDSDTIIRKNYIHVTPVFYPNPTNGIVNILSGNDEAIGNPVKIYNRLGQLIFETIWPQDAGNSYSLDLSDLCGNFFFISFSTSIGTTTDKVVLIRKQ
jgi:lysyl endopeptidase